MKFVLLLSTLLLATFVYTQAQNDLRFDYNWGTNVPGLSPLQINITNNNNNYIVFTFVDNATHSIVSTTTNQGAYDPSQLIPGSNGNEYPFGSGPIQGAGNLFAIVFYASSTATPTGVYYIRDEYDSNLSAVINLLSAQASVVPTPSAVAASPSAVAASPSAVAASPSSVVASASAAASSIVASVAASVAASASAAAFSPSGVAASASRVAASPSVAAVSPSGAAASASRVAASPSGAAASASRAAASPSSSRAPGSSATATTSATATPSPSPCTKDTDGDGVPDCFDLCPRNKQKTAPSGPYGCGNKPKSSHTVIEFDFDLLSPMNCTDMFD